MGSKTLPKKTVKNNNYRQSAKLFFKEQMEAMGGAKPLFKVLYGREHVNNEHITLNNLINRGNYSSEFIGLFIEKLNLQDHTLADVFLKDTNEEEES